MADRHTLHFKHLEPFKNWLIKNNWEMKPLSKSQYEVLRATKNGKWVIIYLKDSATEHYSLTENSIYVVNQWLKERKIRKEIIQEIKEIMETEGIKYLDFGRDEFALDYEEFKYVLEQMELD